MARNRYYRPDYREDEARAIISGLDQGRSVSVVGPPGVGKTNLLRFLDQERLEQDDPSSPWARYAAQSDRKGKIIAVNIDPNALLPALPENRGDIAASAWPGFELLIHRTVTTEELQPAYRLYAGAEESLNLPPNYNLQDEIDLWADRFRRAHAAVTDFKDYLHAHLALRYLERLLESTLKAYQIQDMPIRIAYFLDEFERFLATMPDYFFVALRSIRDRFKYKVMFVTFSRNSLPYLVGDRMMEMEPYIELFHDAPVYLGPFNDRDAWAMVDELQNRTVEKTDQVMGLLIRATGAFAGLMRAGYEHSEKLAQIPPHDFTKAVWQAAMLLAEQKNVAAECETILRGLTPREVTVLYDVAKGRPNQDDQATEELLKKSLLRKDTQGDTIRVMPLVLVAYIRTHPEPPASRPHRPPTIPG